MFQILAFENVNPTLANIYFVLSRSIWYSQIATKYSSTIINRIYVKLLCYHEFIMFNALYWSWDRKQIEEALSWLPFNSDAAQL